MEDNQRNRQTSRQYKDRLLTVDSAVKVFISKNGILSGFLEKHRAEVLDVCITEYNEELHINNEKKISHDEGRIEGREGEVFSSVQEDLHNRRMI